MKPDARGWQCPAPERVRELVAQTRLPRRAVAERLGTSERTLYQWLAGGRRPSYCAVFALEALADSSRAQLMRKSRTARGGRKGK